MCQPAGSGLAFPKRVLCDSCTPDQNEMLGKKESAQAVLGVALGLVLACLGIAAYFFWKAYSVPIPPLP